MIWFVVSLTLCVTVALLAFKYGKFCGMNKSKSLVETSASPTSFKEFQLEKLRETLEKLFAPETASPGTVSEIPSAGHCAVVALLIRSLFEGELVSAKVNEVSHWYNQIREGLYVDLTGDQFGFAKVQISDQPIYPGTRKRDLSEVSTETHLRYSTLRDKYRALTSARQSV